MQDCIVYFFAFFRSYVRNQFWRYLCGIEYVIAEDLNEWHDHCIFGRFFGMDEGFSVLNACCEGFKLVNQIHDNAPSSGIEQVTNTARWLKNISILHIF